ncbi:hypothetical protein GO755_40060 [Spirosoma sp. HMF4905]|uniref:Uncharacterized protein n=1 Tax=Spirosoma arboris TaxID=2682092 RepID=A0A7K1SR44_9BACT|nr:hypothetical protein [Spirosoma arboris]MVM36272.1 hypothetical protein [Spirosoma arboris]
MSTAIQKSQQVAINQRKKGVTKRQTCEAFPKKEDVEILHIELFYANGSVREMNVTSIGGNIELQYIHMRRYLVEALVDRGLVKIHAHYAYSENGNIKNICSWYPFDCLTGREISPEAKLLL